MEVTDIIKKLNWHQYRKYLRYMLGYKAFLNGDTFVRCEYKKLKNLIGKYVEKDSKKEIIYNYRSNDQKELRISIENNSIDSVKIHDILDVNSNYSLIFLFSITMNFNNKAFYDIVVDKVFKFKKTKKLDVYTFVVGAGISLDYGAKKWNELNEMMKNGISEIIGCDLPSLSFGTYDLSQDMKNLNENKFYEILYEAIYGEYNSKREIENDTTCKAIANLICRQAPYVMQQRILSLNYDDFLTKEIECINSDVCDLHKSQPKSSLSIEVVHLHGVIKDNKRFLDIVLTTDDYYSSYKVNSYVYKTFKEHLSKTNIFVGNSLSDYEELKVLRDNFEEDYNSFHYALMIKNNNSISDLYKSLILIKYGIICLWFDDKTEISNFIKNLEFNALY